MKGIIRGKKRIDEWPEFLAIPKPAGPKPRPCKPTSEGPSEGD